MDCPGKNVHSPGAIGWFWVPEPLPRRLLYFEPLRRRMRVRFGGIWIAESENILLLFELGRYPIAYFPEAYVFPASLQRSDDSNRHPDPGRTAWYAVRAGERSAPPRWYVCRADGADRDLDVPDAGEQA